MTARFNYTTRDFSFMVGEWLPCEEVFSFPAYRGRFEPDSVPGLLKKIKTLVETRIAPSNHDGEQNPPYLVDGRIVGPPSYRELFAFLMQEGWGEREVKEFGGKIPHILYGPALEMMGAASPAFMPYIALTGGVAALIDEFAAGEVKKLLLPEFRSGHLSGTICLTEENGGSDVGEISSTAELAAEPDVYYIHGQKVFVTGGDHDMTDNIIYLCLARTLGANPGTSGLSLFAVPKYWPTQDGSMVRNGVEIINIENKLGIRGSVTATVTFGREKPCRGWLLGPKPTVDGKGFGVEIIFKMLKGTRLKTAICATGIVANALNNAYKYATERTQGRPFTDPNGPRVKLIHHEDVKRMIIAGRAAVAGMRSLVMLACYYLDVQDEHPDPVKAQEAEELVEILVPICKAYCSQGGWQTLFDAMQIYGGKGYCEDQPIAQAVRDYKIHSIWEGSNYIQALDFTVRKWRRKGGIPFRRLMDRVTRATAKLAECKALEREKGWLSESLAVYERIISFINEKVKQGQPEWAPLYASDILAASGDVIAAGCVAEQMTIAYRRLGDFQSDREKHWFYMGKVLTCREFLRTVFIRVNALEQKIHREDLGVLSVPYQTLGF